MQKLFRLHKHLFILVAIFFLAFLVRVISLRHIPFGFHEDEVLSGYIGRFILLNGKDVYGNNWPLLYFNKFGDYYIIMPMYLSGLSSFLFGVNEFAVRFPTVFLGSLAVLPLYYIVYQVFKNKTVALLSSLFLAISPWHIVLSRARAEGVLGASLFLIGLAFLIHSIQKKSFHTLIASVFVFFLSYFTYHPYRIIIPLIFIPALLIISLKKYKSMYIFSLLAVAVAFFAFTFYISQTTWGKGRFEQTSIISPLSSVTIKLQGLIFDEGQNSALLARIFHNKAIGFAREFVFQYISYFSPTFLFLVGTTSSLYYSVPEQGLLYIGYAVALIGAIVLHKKNKKVHIDNHLFYFILYILFISPIPAALTLLDAPNVHRSLFFGVMIIPFIAYGFYLLMQIRISKIPLWPILAILIILECIYFQHQYSRHSASYQSTYRNDGQPELMKYVYKHKADYKRLMVPVQATMPLYYLFYKNDFDKKYVGKFGFNIRIPSIDGIEFIEGGCAPDILNRIYPDKDTVMVVDSSCQVNTEKYEIIHSIHGVNELIQWRFIKFKQPQL